MSSESSDERRFPAKFSYHAAKILEVLCIALQTCEDLGVVFRRSHYCSGDDCRFLDGIGERVLDQDMNFETIYGFLHDLLDNVGLRLETNALVWSSTWVTHKVGA